jgi:hypothetical protein
MRSHVSVSRRVDQRQRKGLREYPVIFIACLWHIETLNDQLKNITQIEHARHRSLTGCMVHLVGGLIAYTFQPKKPSLGLGRGKSGLPGVV